VPRACTICVHKQRKKIEKSLIKRESYRHIAAHFEVSTQALKRHKENHLSKALVKSDVAKKLSDAEQLVKEVQEVKKFAKDIFLAAKKDKNFPIQLSALARMQGTLELLLKVAGEIKDQSNTTIIINNPQWINMRTTILRVLEKHPAAHLDMIKALKNVEVK
jgi:hypothetical protein